MLFERFLRYARKLASVLRYASWRSRYRARLSEMTGTVEEISRLHFVPLEMTAYG